MLLDLRMNWAWISPRFMLIEWRSKKSGQAQVPVRLFSVVLSVSCHTLPALRVSSLLTLFDLISLFRSLFLSPSATCHALAIEPERPGGGVRNDAEEFHQIASQSQVVVSE